MAQNCLTSCSIGCLFCIQRCNVEKIRVAFTFLPPNLSYGVAVPDVGGPSDTCKMVYSAEQLNKFKVYTQAAENAQVHFVRTSRGERCPLVWLRPSVPMSEQPIVLLHCHGNATDIGMMMGPYFEMTKQMGIEVVGVEYSGYGMSTGSPSAANTYADVEAAYNHVVERGVPPERIIAYGQSVGSGPATYIASKHQIGGVILHSPLMSGIKVIDPQPDKCCRPSCVFGCCDFYPNDQRLKRATCPTFVIHGQADDIVPFYHGSRLAALTPEDYRWPGYFPLKAGHNNIVESNAAAYFRELAKFINGVNENAAGRGSSASSTQEKPMQVEMQCFGTREADRDDLGMETFPEPTVGPQNNMYSGMRREKDGAGGAPVPVPTSPIPPESPDSRRRE